VKPRLGLGGLKQEEEEEEEEEEEGIEEVNLSL
jgi:hypothetical protein